MRRAWYLDGGLLKNGEHPDVYDGKVLWTSAHYALVAFLWWDSLRDRRCMNSASCQG